MELTTSATKPSVRYQHSSVLYNGQMVMFGGYGSQALVNKNEVWTLNLTSYDWTQLTTSATKPIARKYHSSIFYNGQMVVFAGSCVLNALYVENDVWTLQLDLSPTTTTQPLTTTTQAPTTTTTPSLSNNITTTTSVGNTTTPASRVENNELSAGFISKASCGLLPLVVATMWMF